MHRLRLGCGGSCRKCQFQKIGSCMPIFFGVLCFQHALKMQVWLRLHPRQVWLGNSRCMFFLVEGRHDMKGFCQAKETEPKRSGVLAGLVTTGGVCCVCRQVTTSVKLKKNMLESVFGLPQAVELVPEIVVFCLNGKTGLEKVQSLYLAALEVKAVQPSAGWPYPSINLLESQSKNHALHKYVIRDRNILKDILL